MKAKEAELRFMTAKAEIAGPIAMSNILCVQELIDAQSNARSDWSRSRLQDRSPLEVCRNCSQRGTLYQREVVDNGPKFA